MLLGSKISSTHGARFELKILARFVRKGVRLEQAVARFGSKCSKNATCKVIIIRTSDINLHVALYKLHMKSTIGSILINKYLLLQLLPIRLLRSCPRFLARYFATGVMPAAHHRRKPCPTSNLLHIFCQCRSRVQHSHESAKKFTLLWRDRHPAPKNSQVISISSVYR